MADTQLAPEPEPYDPRPTLGHVLSAFFGSILKAIADALASFAYEYRKRMFVPPKVKYAGLSGSIPDAVADAEATQMETGPQDIPFERTVYRGTDGLLYTSSMLEHGMGKGMRFMYAANITPDEAEGWIERTEALSLDKNLTPFEKELMGDLKKNLAEKWAK